MKKRYFLLKSLSILLFSTQISFAQDYKDEYSVSITLSDAFPWGEAANKWAELVAQRTENRINLKIFPNSQLTNGDQTKEFSAMRSGLIDMAVGSTINWSPQVVELNLFSLPFLMKDEADLDALTQGESANLIFQAIESKGIIPLGWAENGFRELSNSKRSISTPEDLNGMKIRVVGSPLFLDTFTALGANPTQMSWADAKPALATGAVDGQENPLSVFDVARIDTVEQKFLTLWGYMADPLIFAVNPKIWQSFTPEDQEILKQAAIDAGKFEIESSRKENANRLAAIKERGVEVTELSAEQKQDFQNATQSVYDDWVPKIGEELVNVARQAVESN